jgi:Mg-chelatase subunit ChlI
LQRELDLSRATSARVEVFERQNRELRDELMDMRQTLLSQQSTDDCVSCASLCDELSAAQSTLAERTTVCADLQSRLSELEVGSTAADTEKWWC